MTKVVKKGFGIKKDSRGASSLKFAPKPEKDGGLCIAGIKAVEVGTAKIGEDANGLNADFAGMEVPTINFIFEGLPVEGTNQCPVYMESFKAIPVIKDSTDADWLFESLSSKVKHFIDVLGLEVLGDEAWHPDYDKLLDLELDFENGMDAVDVCKSFAKFFKGMATVFNGDADAKLPSLIKDDKGNTRLLWIKLLLYRKDKEVAKGNFAFSSFPDEGIIEIYREGVEPIMKIKVEKGESIIPKAQTSSAPPASAPASNPSAPAGGPGKPSGKPGFMS